MTFYKTSRDMLVQSYFQRLCLADKRIVLLKENRARDPEFDYDCSVLTDLNNSECKANSILKTWSARFSWGSASPWKILLFAETTEKRTTKMYMEGHLKNKEKLISHLNLNSSCFCSFNTDDKTSVLTFFCHLTCLRCNVSFVLLKIASACRPWLKNVLCLSYLFLEDGKLDFLFTSIVWEF